MNIFIESKTVRVNNLISISFERESGERAAWILHVQKREKEKRNNHKVRKEKQKLNGGRQIQRGGPKLPLILSTHTSRELAYRQTYFGMRGRGYDDDDNHRRRICSSKVALSAVNLECGFGVLFLPKFTSRSRGI